MTATCDAIVLGAGVAGLSAATRLAEAGARVLVLEARPSGGGRATAFTDPATGERVDNGQHVLFGCYRETLRFLDRVGSRGGVRVAPRLAVDLVLPNGRATQLRTPTLPSWLPSSVHLAAGVLGWDAMPWGERLAVFRLAGPLRRAQAAFAKGARASGETLPDEVVGDWLVRHGQGGYLLEWLWEPLALAALNQSIRVAAAEPFVRVIADLLSGDRSNAALVLPTCPLDALYVTPSAAYLAARGGELRMAMIGRVGLGADGAPLVVTRDGILQAPVVICAVPWHELPRVLGDGSLAGRGLEPVTAAAAGTDAASIVTVNLWFDRQLFDTPVVGLPARTFQWAFERRLLAAGATSLSMVASGADHLLRQTNAEIFGLAYGELRATVPAARQAVLHRHLTVREAKATFSLAPGQPARPGTTTPVPGLFLAGDWIDTGLPATIEGAAESGHRAAEAARACLTTHP